MSNAEIVVALIAIVIALCLFSDYARWRRQDRERRSQRMVTRNINRAMGRMGR